MSGFSPAWLALREPADRAARNRDVLAACRSFYADHTALTICDMGAGTGAAVRALADILPRTQTWTLADRDAANLAVAEKTLSAWTAAHRSAVTVRTRAIDFAETPDCWPPETGLVTASALFDLVSATWIDRFAQALAGRRLALLSMLTFNGALALEPAQAHDTAVFGAFRTHQTGDKGFGPAAGADAHAHLARALAGAGYKVTDGDSPWIIGRDQTALMQAVLEGIAQAARETELLANADIDQWLRAAVAETGVLTVGHRDLFAAPP